MHPRLPQRTAGDTCAAENEREDCAACRARPPACAEQLAHRPRTTHCTPDPQHGSQPPLCHTHGGCFRSFLVAMLRQSTQQQQQHSDATLQPVDAGHHVSCSGGGGGTGNGDNAVVCWTTRTRWPSCRTHHRAGAPQVPVRAGVVVGGARAGGHGVRITAHAPRVLVLQQRAQPAACRTACVCVCVLAALAEDVLNTSIALFDNNHSSTWRGPTTRRPCCWHTARVLDHMDGLLLVVHEATRMLHGQGRAAVAPAGGGMLAHHCVLRPEQCADTRSSSTTQSVCGVCVCDTTHCLVFVLQRHREAMDGHIGCVCAVLNTHQSRAVFLLNNHDAVAVVICEHTRSCPSTTPSSATRSSSSRRQSFSMPSSSTPSLLSSALPLFARHSSSSSLSSTHRQQQQQHEHDSSAQGARGGGADDCRAQCKVAGRRQHHNAERLLRAVCGHSNTLQLVCVDTARVIVPAATGSVTARGCSSASTGSAVSPARSKQHAAKVPVPCRTCCCCACTGASPHTTGGCHTLTATTTAVSSSQSHDSTAICAF